MDGGARQVFIIDAVEENSVTFEIDAGNGSTLVSVEGGGISVVDDQSQEVVGILPPWAVDADGEPVPTHFEIDGTTVTQHVQVGSATAFPVVADPTLCGNKIHKVTFVRRDGGRTMSVQPTACGRWWNGWSGWVEAKREGNVSYSGDRDASMWYQYICHFDWAPWRETWNLDEWRPNVGYLKTVRARCNP